MTTHHTVALEGMEFFSYHGVHAEERRLGNRYTVDVTLTVDLTAAAATDALPHTVDYGAVYALVATQMAAPSCLLEHVAQRVLTALRGQFPAVRAAEVGVAKHNPPLGGICRRARVTLRETFLPDTA